MTQTFAAGQTLTAEAVNGELAMPTGAIIPYAVATAPTTTVGGVASWLLCQGQQVLIATYPTLYSLLTTTYGPTTNGLGSAGTSHFRLPDLRGRVPMGQGAGPGTNDGSSGSGEVTGVPGSARTIGQWAGRETHQLLATESGLPSHSTQGDGGHAHTVSNESADHGHNVNGNTFNTQVVGINAGVGANFGVWADQGGGTGARGNHGHYTGGRDTVHNHTVNGGSHTHPVAAANAAQAHNITQPFIVINYIIKT